MKSGLYLDKKYHAYLFSKDVNQEVINKFVDDLMDYLSKMHKLTDRDCDLFGVQKVGKETVSFFDNPFLTTVVNELNDRLEQEGSEDYYRLASIDDGDDGWTKGIYLVSDIINR